MNPLDQVIGHGFCTVLTGTSCGERVNVGSVLCVWTASKLNSTAWPSVTLPHIWPLLTFFVFLKDDAQWKKANRFRRTTRFKNFKVDFMDLVCPEVLAIVLGVFHDHHSTALKIWGYSFLYHIWIKLTHTNHIAQKLWCLYWNCAEC